LSSVASDGKSGPSAARYTTDKVTVAITGYRLEADKRRNGERCDRKVSIPR
jgi:hypothetical protein